MLGSFIRAAKRIQWRFKSYPKRMINLDGIAPFSIITHTERDEYVSPIIRDTGNWEAFETSLFLALVKPGDVVIDIGANIGWYSLIAASRVGRSGQVLSFEPSAENFALLARNIRINKFSNVRLFNAAIGEKEAIGNLFLSETNRGDHQLNSPDNARPSERVTVRSLANVFAELKLRPAIIKIDTQGSEEKILSSIPADAVKETILFIEFWPHGLERSSSSSDGLLQKLCEFGHDIYIIDHSANQLQSVSLEYLRDRALGNLRPETQAFVDLLCIPKGQPLPCAVAEGRALEPKIVAQWSGFCPICDKDTNFIAYGTWFRDHLHCESCEGGSIPRERALMSVLNERFPNWRELCIHESSPEPRGVSNKLSKGCFNYIPSQFFPDTMLGEEKDGVRCENLEQQSFDDNQFDIVVSQDVMEHVFDPERAYAEIYRTLKPGGAYIHTTPIYKDIVQTRCCAKLDRNDDVIFLEKPEYHGNPISDSGSLVTFRYGYDIAELIAKWTNFDVEVRRYHDKYHGVVAEFSEVIVCYKR